MQHACHLPDDSAPALQRTPAPHVRMRRKAPEACSSDVRPATRAGPSEAPSCNVGALPTGSAGLGGCWQGGLGLQRPAQLPPHLHCSLALVRAARGCPAGMGLSCQQLHSGCWQASCFLVFRTCPTEVSSPGLTGQAARQGCHVTQHCLTLQNTQQAASAGWFGSENSWVTLQGDSSDSCKSRLTFSACCTSC